MKHKALINRGSLTFWHDESAIQAWYDESNTSSRSRPQRYSELAITTVLILKLTRPPVMKKGV